MVITAVRFVIVTTVVVREDEDEVRKTLNYPQCFHQSTVVLVPTRAPLGREEGGQLDFSEARREWRGAGCCWRRVAADLTVQRRLTQCRHHGSWIRRRSWEGGDGSGGACIIREILA